MKVTILLGSVRDGRQSHRAAHYVEKRLNEKGVNAGFYHFARAGSVIFPEGITEIKTINTIIQQVLGFMAEW